LTSHLRNSRKGPDNPSTGKLFRETEWQRIGD
jgi:hypothetical protein